MSTFLPEQWQTLSPYLDQALAMTNDERAAWLSSLAEENPSLVEQLRALYHYTPSAFRRSSTHS